MTRSRNCASLGVERGRACMLDRHQKACALSQPILTVLFSVGGTDVKLDVAALREGGANVLVGTPGRLADVLLRVKELRFGAFELLVLDEADRLLDMGFERQLHAIIGYLPKQRRTGLFSATQTDAVAELARAGLRNPVRVAVAAAAGAAGAAGGKQRRTPATLELTYQLVPAEHKLAALCRFLAAHRGEKTVVFFLTCACVDLFAAVLPRLSLGDAAEEDAPPPLHALHGRQPQRQRDATLAKFTDAEGGAVLLCTDVAARGLDIPDVDWIVQFDMPQDPNAFVHRVGRTARMGRRGASLALLMPHEETYVDFLKIRSVPLVQVPLEAGGADQAQERAPDGEGEGDEKAEGEEVRVSAELAAQSARLRVAARAAGEADRDVMEKATRAFVSYARGYREHQCRFIFRVADLPFGALAALFGLLRMPKMPELARVNAKRLEGFAPSEVDPDSVAFRDRAREKQRRAALARRAEEEARRQEEREEERAQAAARATKELSRREENKLKKERKKRRKEAARGGMIGGGYADDHNVADEEAMAREWQRMKHNRKQGKRKGGKARKGGGGDDEDDEDLRALEALERADAARSGGGGGGGRKRSAAEEAVFGVGGGGGRRSKKSSKRS